MSYDLLVFDPRVAPRSRADFMVWYNDLTQWGAARDYNSPAGLNPQLKAFYDKMRVDFPPMNGPDAYEFEQAAQPVLEAKHTGFFAKLFGPKAAKPAPPPVFKDAMVTDYSIANHAIYMAFSGGISSQAYTSVFNTALSAEVGFFNASADNGEILHDPQQFDALMGL